ncbi:MAG: helix-turn-helix transcriptional regulator [Lachnospiraceae bacterium]|nr:helix-turn-helix transcriptional regulator [Lachnospiraceae bacterium]
MILADKITEERKKNGWSQEELAEQLGVSRQAVSKWESAGSVPDLQKIIQLANIFGVSTDYLLKDEMEAEDRQGEYTAQDDSDRPLRRVSMEEANDFLDVRRKSAPVIANAVTLCILSPVLLLLLGAFSESHMFHITEGIAAGVGCTVLFALIAVAVFLFITIGMKMSHSEHLEKEMFETEYGVTGMVREKSRAYEQTFTMGIAGGVVLCILSVVPVIIAGAAEAPDYICAICVAGLLVMIAVGVNIMVRVSMIRSSYDTLLQEGEYSRREKKMKNKLDAFSGAYWCLATAIYLGWSFWTMRWEITWILWPVAGVLFAAVSSMVRAFTKVDE